MTYCIRCGTPIEEQHAYCSRCGTARYEDPGGKPASDPDSLRTQPPLPPTRPADASASAATAIVRARQAALFAEVAPQLSVVRFLCAAGGVFWAILLTQTAAVIAAPAGRASIVDVLLKSGVGPEQRTTALVVYSLVLVLFCLIPIALHAIAYYGLRGHHRAGWVVAVLIAGAWSFVLIGIPFLYILIRRDVRHAFGFIET